MREEFDFCLIGTLQEQPEEKKVSFAGLVVDIKKNRRSGERSALIRDMTGDVWVLMSDQVYENAKNEDPVERKKILRFFGVVALKTNGNAKICRIIEIHPWVSLLNDGRHPSEFIVAREQAARYYIARIMQATARYFRSRNYLEIHTRLISREWSDDGLEPMRVVYPGFGGPTTLAVSPSSQLSDFLATSLCHRVFSIGYCLSESYRSFNESTESPVVMAKAFNLIERALPEVMINLSKAAYASVGIEMEKCEWLEYEDDTVWLYSSESKGLRMIEQRVNIPVIGANWHSTVCVIFRLLDGHGSLLVEGSREAVTGSGHVLSSITVYPAQFLGSDHSFSRRIDNLGCSLQSYGSVYK